MGKSISIRFRFGGHQPQIIHVNRLVPGEVEKLVASRGQYEPSGDAPLDDTNNTPVQITYIISAAFKFEPKGDEPWREHRDPKVEFIAPDLTRIGFDDYIKKDHYSDGNYTDAVVEVRVLG